MADVMSHGGDAGGDSPQLGAHDYQHNANPVSVKIRSCYFILTYSTRYFVNEILIYIFCKCSTTKKNKGSR